MTKRAGPVILLFASALLIAPATGRGGGGGWRPAEGERRWSFPADHGAHRGYRTEWWYVTGHLHDGGGRTFGYQLTFFRVGVRKEPAPEGNAWAVRDLYAAHFAIADVAAGRFIYDERISREGPGLAGSLGTALDVGLLGWSLRQDGEKVRLAARTAEMEIDLLFDGLPAPLVHGRGGLSRKGPGSGQASWYYSLPDLKGGGWVRTPWSGGKVPVRGGGWLDHEFGSNQLSEGQEGWDWLSLRLDDGGAVMIYLMRSRDGFPGAYSSGTFRSADGRVRVLTPGEFRLQSLGDWKSPRSGGVYPSRWRLSIPSEDLVLNVTPLLPDQELVTSASTGVTYWEGAVRAEGRAGIRPLTAEGYVELTGYAGSLGGLF